MNGLIIGIGIIVFVVALYFGSYILNKNTAAPDGVTVIHECSTCGNGACSLSRKENYSNSHDQHCEIYEEV